MTNEERIDWLCRLRSMLPTISIPKTWRDMFFDALSEAIEQTKDTDTISRQKAIDRIVFGFNGKPYFGDSQIDMEVIKFLRNFK